MNFYQENLGFTCTFKWEVPVTYAVLKRGNTSIHLAHMFEPKVLKSPIAYIFCNDINALYLEVLENEVKILEPLRLAEDYGMHEFVIQDNTGHQLVFGSQ